MNENVLMFVKFLEDNNPIALTNSLFKRGYVIGKNETIASKLYKVFESNRKDFISILKEAGFNENAGNWTTSSEMLLRFDEFSNNFRASRGMATRDDGEIDTSVGREWYNDVLDTLVGTDESQSTVTETTTAPATGTQTKTIVTAVGAFAVVGLIVWLGFKYA